MDDDIEIKALSKAWMVTALSLCLFIGALVFDRDVDRRMFASALRDALSAEMHF